MSPRALVYLHGFASSPRSSKARFFQQRAAAAGLAFECPDLNLPEFGTLTVARMLDEADRAVAQVPKGPVALVGSSLGAFVALIAAARAAARDGAGNRVDRLVLLAPAIDLVASLEEEFGPEKMADWERAGRLPFFHYGDSVERDLDWGFMADARRYDADQLEPACATLVYQGTRDEVVRPDRVRHWAEGRPQVTLRLVDDDHQLLDHLEVMWQEVARFVGAA